MRKQIKLLASEYEVGDQTELLKCPFCKGGLSKDKSFTMNIHPEGVLYICYRASCGERGFIPSLRIEQPVQRTTKPSMAFTGDQSDLPEMVSSFLVQRFPCMTPELLQQEGVKYSHQRQRILFPIFDVRGYEYGLQARSYTAKPKAISYFMNQEVPKLHFPLGFKLSEEVVLVEDQISAMILCSQGIPAGALLGTSLSENNAHHLQTVGVKRLIIFLDADAAKKALQIQKQFSLELPSRIYYHESDPKDLQHDQIQELMKWM